VGYLETTTVGGRSAPLGACVAHGSGPGTSSAAMARVIAFAGAAAVPSQSASAKTLLAAWRSCCRSGRRGEIERDVVRIMPGPAHAPAASSLRAEKDHSGQGRDLIDRARASFTMTLGTGPYRRLLRYGRPQSFRHGKATCKSACAQRTAGLARPRDLAGVALIHLTRTGPFSRAANEARTPRFHGPTIGQPTAPIRAARAANGDPGYNAERRAS
jgi:hypothetical protein